MRTLPVMRSTSAPQKSKMKPWQSDELISSASVGAVSCGGVQNTVSRIVSLISSGSSPGAQWLIAARREKEIAASGLVLATTLPAANTRSSGRTLSRAAAIRESLSRSLLAARCVAPATAGAKRLGLISHALVHAYLSDLTSLVL